MEENSLTVLGCSSATPNSVRFPSSQILHALGKYFLLDCGEGAQMQLRRAKIPFENINVIFISHLHGDHYYGLFGLLASLNLTGRKTPLVIYGPEGLEKIVRFLFQNTEQTLIFPIFFKTLPKEPFACIEEKKNYKLYSIYYRIVLIVGDFIMWKMNGNVIFPKMRFKSIILELRRLNV